jgi:hypothetical protein
LCYVLNMANQKNSFLIIAAALNAIAAALHLACIYFGAPLFRFLGTEVMAVMFESGHLMHPIIACLVLGSMLFVWSAYALSGAGVIRRLPFLRFVLTGITLVYLIRGMAFPLVMPYFPGNSALFWVCSSLIIFVFGVIHLIGVKQVWAQL